MMVMIITSTIITTITTITDIIPDPEQAELFELEELHCSLSLSRRSVTTGESYSANDHHHHVHDVDMFCDHVNDMEIDIK